MLYLSTLATTSSLPSPPLSHPSALSCQVREEGGARQLWSQLLNQPCPGDDVACVLVNSGCSLVAVCVDQGKRSYNPSSPLRIEQHSSTLVQKFTTGVAGEQVDEAGKFDGFFLFNFFVTSFPVFHIISQQCCHLATCCLWKYTAGNRHSQKSLEETMNRWSALTVCFVNCFPLHTITHAQAEGEMVVTVSQHYLDLEQWLCQTLPYHLARHQLNFHCLTDYDLQLVEVGACVSILSWWYIVHTCRCVGWRGMSYLLW